MSHKVSFFNNVHDTEPKDYDLEDWLKKTINPPKEWNDDIEKYRQTLLRRDKEKLPCITISAAFKGVRNLNNIKHKNKLICVDVDRKAKSNKKKSNLCADFLLVKELFMQHPSTFYAGYSCSGPDVGVYAVIRIQDENDLEGYFEFFREKFSHIGINIDEACKDYTRLRFFSVDKDAYLNTNALYYKRKIVEDIKPKTVKKSKSKPTNQSDSKHLTNEDKIKIIVEKANQHKIDITSSYEDWVKIAAGLNAELGDEGLGYFLQLSQHHPEFNFEKTRLKYHSCKKMNSVKINSLFFIADSYGIRY